VGRGARIAISVVAGVIAGALGSYVVLRMALSKGLAEVASYGDATTRVYLLIAFVGLVVGSSAYAYVRGHLERRAEQQRIPTARSRPR
jgi:H+/Cl- antiporter ClcA